MPRCMYVLLSMCNFVRGQCEVFVLLEQTANRLWTPALEMGMNHSPGAIVQSDKQIK